MLETDTNQRVTNEPEPIIFLMPAGLLPVVVMSYEKIRQLHEKEAERERNKDKQPPNPPRRPNIPISGQVAIQYL